MTYIPNSIEARDIASLVHMQTNLRQHQQEGPLVIARGEGCRVFDDSGRDYIEAVAGLWCASLGFASERLAKVAYEQMRQLGYYHLYRHRSNEPAIALAETLLKIAPVPMARVVFQCSGSEANDTAIKLAWYYWNAVGEPQRTKIIARQMAYHGNTCAAVSLSGKPDMHAGFGLPFAPFKHTEFPHYYRRHEPGETRDGVLDPHGRGAGDAHPSGRTRDDRRLFRRAGHGRGRRDRSAAGLFREGAGGAAQVRHPVRGRRGDLRLCPHRRDVGLADLCASRPTWSPRPRRSPPPCSRSRRCSSTSASTRRCSRNRTSSAILRTAITYAGHPGGGRGRARSAEDLCGDRHRRPRQTPWPGPAVGARPAQGASARRRRARESASSSAWS